MSLVLVVEDEAAIAELISINLRHAGYQVAIAASADQAQHAVNGVLPDLVLLDWGLGGSTTVDASGTYNYNGTSITSTSGGTTDITTVISLTSTDMKTDFTETSSNGTVFKNVGYFKKIN